MSKQLFVENLSADTSEPALAAAFAEWGGQGAAIPTNDSLAAQEDLLCSKSRTTGWTTPSRP